MGSLPTGSRKQGRRVRFELVRVRQDSIDIVGDDDAVIDCAEPTGHDDADASGVIESGDLIGQCPADGEAFELGAETRALHVLRVMSEGARGCGLDMRDTLAAIRNILLQRVERGLDQVVFAGLIFLVAEVRPVFVTRIGAGDDEAARSACGARCADSRTNRCGW